MKIPIDVAYECHPAISNNHLDRASGDDAIALQNIESSFGYLIIGKFLLERIAHLNLFGDYSNAIDSSHGRCRRMLLREAGNMSGQGDDSLLYGNSDMRCIEAGFVCGS